MSPDLITFTEAMVPEAGALLAERQRTIRQVHPRLPDTFDDLEEARKIVRVAAERSGTTGAAAFLGGKMAAYLLAERVTDMLWGRSVWMRLPGCAIAPGVDREIVRNLYTRLAAPLVAQGCFYHVAVVPVADRGLIEAFFALSFGIEQIHGIIDLQENEIAPPELPPGVTIRQATGEDRELLESFSDTIWRHQVQAPVWGIHLPEKEEERRKSYGDMASDPTALVYVAFYEDQPAGIQAYFTRDPDDSLDMLCWPDGLELCVGGTREAFRERGIGTALTRFGLYAARAAGCRYVLTDWRSTNLLSSRFWPRKGFVPVAYRMTRRIDDRILWGRGLPV